MTLEYVKSFLKIDFDDDDEFIALIIEAAREYVIAALGKCDEDIARVRLLMLVIISDMYEKRALTVNSDSTNTKVQYTIRSIINQLSCNDMGDDDNE